MDGGEDDFGFSEASEIGRRVATKTVKQQDVVVGDGGVRGDFGAPLLKERFGNDEEGGLSAVQGEVGDESKRHQRLTQSHLGRYDRRGSVLTVVETLSSPLNEVELMLVERGGGLDGEHGAQLPTKRSERRAQSRGWIFSSNDMIDVSATRDG